VSWIHHTCPVCCNVCCNVCCTASTGSLTACPTLPACLLLKTPQGRPRCLPEREAVVRVIKPLLSALGYLHEQGIIHR
jgi:hypothetical protein